MRNKLPQMFTRKVLPHIALTLFVLQLLLMLLSWILSAVFPVNSIHSLLSSEGLRWFLGRFTTHMATPQLVWLLLLSLAYGVLSHSKLLCLGKSYRERRAFVITLLLAVVIVGVVLLLTMIPHAVLLSATGSLWPSPFSQSLVPMTAFAIVLLSTCYGMISGHLDSLPEVYEALLDGLRSAAPLFLFYILIAQMVESVGFVFL